MQVICTIKRSQNALSGHQEKLFKVDHNIGMAMSGLTADARTFFKKASCASTCATRRSITSTCSRRATPCSGSSPRSPKVTF